MHLIHRINWYIGWLCPRLRDCPKNEYVAEKRNFEGKCEILKTLSSKDIISWQTSTLEGRFIYFITLPLIYISRETACKKKKSVLLCSRPMMDLLYQYHWTLQGETFLLPCKIIESKSGNFWAAFRLLNLSFFDGNNRRANIDADKGYWVITVRW